MPPTTTSSPNAASTSSHLPSPPATPPHTPAPLPTPPATPPHTPAAPNPPATPPAANARRPRQPHHDAHTYKCLRVHSEYDCGHELPQIVRDPGCWKCHESQPNLCRPSDWDIGADGLCPDCETLRRGEERARLRRAWRGDCEELKPE
ncbi:hypothetical protein GJ744_009640 [Endocarpon pusillum]|uniref:Uncharacterized protein n=1 Tax=Endocarpon pusillum TaxID=364733 RepID=A0A8H7AFL9_9EURO|nr:hypothetical protein GJ744_009640 [Endocarpon pusillum]